MDGTAERSSQPEGWEVALPDWAEETAIIFLPFLGFSLQFLSACPSPGSSAEGAALHDLSLQPG